MTEAEVNNLVENFKEANKSLRKRSVTIGVLTILTIGLVYMESYRLSTVMDLSNYKYKLDEISELQDTAFIKVIDGQDEKYFPMLSGCSSCLERLTLFKKIKANNYDKKMVVDAIVDIDTRIDKVNEEKAISILGFSIPIKPMYYLFFFIMLVLFHDFTQTIIYKSKAYKRIKGLGIPNWKLGFEQFGFYNTSNNSSLKFVRFTASLLSSIFILCPFITSLMMLDLPKGNSSFEEIIVPLIIFCFVLIIIDTFVIFYWENLWGFRKTSNQFLGKYRTSKPQMRGTWLGVSVVFSIFLMIVVLDYDASFGFKLLFFLLGGAQITGLYFSMLKCFDKPTKFRRGIRAAMLITTFGWFSFIMFGTNNIGRVYDVGNFEYVFMTWLILFVISVIVAFIYARWFLVDRYKTNVQPTNTLNDQNIVE